MNATALTPFSPGHIALTYRSTARSPAGLTVESRRPQAARLLVGKTPAEAMRLLPMLFSVCGQAQGAAAEAALHAAGADHSPRPEPTAAVAREQAIEHLWRLLIDWPELLAARPARVPEMTGACLPARVFAEWARRLRRPDAGADGALPAELADFVRSAEYATHLGALQDALTADEIVAERGPLEALPTGEPLLHALHDDPASRAWDEGFCSRPTRSGAPVETGSFVEQAARPEVARLLAEGRPLAARLEARAAALRQLAEARGAGQWPQVSALQPRSGEGLACVQTARGGLVHHVVLTGERISAYAVLAPTEWNFHPQSAWIGALERALSKAPGPADLIEWRLRAWGLALDPCVPLLLHIEKEA